MIRCLNVAKSDIVFKSGERVKIKIVEFPLSKLFTQWSKKYG